jgi:hypothetical protein
MIYVGLDDTDTLDAPGTNQLARYIVRELADKYHGRLILRHQLLEDPRVPCTRKNGCASMLLEPIGNNGAERAHSTTSSAGSQPAALTELIGDLRDIMIPWCPHGSDPGLCVTTSVPPAVTSWGFRCQRELVTQREARQIAASHDIYLEGLGGTEDGVIGALAAIGLMVTHNDGRVVHFGFEGQNLCDVTGVLTFDQILSQGVDEVRRSDTNEPVTTGTIDIGKHLRPNYRNGRVVLFVARSAENAAHEWVAERIK